MRPLAYLLILSFLLILFGVIRAATAGGFDPDIPIEHGPCNTLLEPTDIPAEKGKRWKRLRSTDRLKVASSGKEIREFQVLYCREYTAENRLVREYIKAEEWYR